VIILDLALFFGRSKDGINGYELGIKNTQFNFNFAKNEVIKPQYYELSSLYALL